MISKILLAIFTLAQILCVAQKTDILHQSAYKHDYAVSSPVMFEDLNDTMRGKYIATIKITDIHLDGIIGNSLNILKMKAKGLGANIYYVVSYKQDDQYTEVITRVFFAAEKMLKNNDEKKIKNTIYVFNQFRGKEDTAFFYLNNDKIIFNQEKFYRVEAKIGEPYNLEITPTKQGGLKLTYSKPKRASFIIIPANKHKIVGINASTKGVLTNVNPGLEIQPYLIGFKKNRPVEIDYDLGRFLSEIYH